MDLFYIEQQHSKSISEATGLTIYLLSGLYRLLPSMQRLIQSTAMCSWMVVIVVSWQLGGEEITLRGLTKMMK